LDLFVSGVNVQTQEEVAVKLVSEVVMDSHVACLEIFMTYVAIVFVCFFSAVNELCIVLLF
jgi:hypothetical protein